MSATQWDVHARRPDDREPGPVDLQHRGEPTQALQAIHPRRPSPERGATHPGRPYRAAGDLPPPPAAQAGISRLPHTPALPMRPGCSACPRASLRLASFSIHQAKAAYTWNGQLPLAYNVQSHRFSCCQGNSCFLQLRGSETMQELTERQIDEVSGGSLSGDIAFGLAGTWASTVAGAAAGSIVPGAGTLAGAGVGFVLGASINIGYALATSPEPSDKQAGS